MGRAPCCDKANVKKGPWSPEEDAKLKEYIEKHGTGGNWIALPQKVGLKRCGKSCRLRWLNYLRPNIKHGEFSDEEDRIICTLFANIGSRWSIIAAQLPGRTDNDIKNYWNTKLKKKLMGFVSNSPPYNPHKKFMINPPTIQNPSHLESSSSTTSSFSLSRQPFLMSSSFYKDHCSNSYNYHYQSSSTSTNNPPCSTTRYFSSGLEQPMSDYSNPMMTTSTCTFNSNHPSLNFQAQDHNFVNTVGNNSVHCYYPHMNDNNSANNLLMFGSSTNEGSCSTSSEGSCNYQIKQEEMGFQCHQGSFMGMLNNNNNYGSKIGDIDHDYNLNLMWKSRYFGETPLENHDQQYSSCVLEDVKQLISSSSHGFNNFSLIFNVDENKTQENKVMYF